MSNPVTSSSNGDADPLNSDDYDPIDHLNAIFSHPSTLSSVDNTYRTLQSYQDDLDDEIDGLEAEQEATAAQCLERMQASRAELAELFERIESVRERALQTERNITEMTADIKQLDNTKKNLTLSMTALKRLQMLTTAYDQLKALIKTRQYQECAQLLQAVMQLMLYFKSYRSIDQIATLSRNVAEVQRELLEQVCEDFEITFTKEEVPQKRGMLHEACLVIDALGDAARSRLVTWFCNTELRQYRHIFKADQEAGSLDNIDRRYAWFRKTLKVYDEEYAAIFPGHWRVGEVLANVFAEGTKDDYRSILSKTMRSNQSLDVKLLLSCLQQTLDFEQGLERRFNNTSRTSIDTTVSSNEATGFGSAISVAFEPYLSLWVAAQERELANLIPQYKSRPTRPLDEDFSPQQVMSSSTELFSFYRVSFNQCAKLSTGQPLLDLSKVFGKFLEQYAQQVLLFGISEKATGATPSRVPSLEDLVVVLNTADYCYTTSNQLEERIKARIDESFKEKVDLQSQADAFMGIAGTTVRNLVRRVEVDLEPVWREMRNIAWSRIETAENQSSYIPTLKQRLKDGCGAILELLHKQQYARAFADNLVELFSNTYLANITQCRPISEAGAEQLLLDTYEIRTALSQIMPGAPIPPLYLKRVNASMSRIEPLLKTLQVRPAPPEALVQAYLIHISDLSEANFRKILDLKGLRAKAEQNQLIELFQLHKQSPRYKDSLVDKSPLLTPLMVTSGNTGVLASATANMNAPTNLNVLQNHLSSALGNSANLSLSAIMNTPREAGRVSSPPPPSTFNSEAAPSTSSFLSGINMAANSSTASVPANVPNSGVGGLNIPGLTAGVSNITESEGAAKLNENLKNIGQFFRRDLGRFGGFGGGRFGVGSGANSNGGSAGGSKGVSPSPDDRR